MIRMKVVNNEFDHAPGAELDYGFDWSDKLKDGETITSSTWDVSDGVVSTKEQVDGAVTSLFVGGDTVAGAVYVLKNTIETSAGRVDSRVIYLSCKVL